MSRFFNWALETAFVVTTLIVLKLWIFPFFINLWFLEHSLISDWTVIIFAVMSCVVYIGLGSTAKHIYGLSWIRALFGLVLLHLLPFFLINKKMFVAWQGLFLDGFSLFLPNQTLSPSLLLSIYLGLFLLGRGISVTEMEKRAFEQKRFMQLKR